MKKRLFMFLFGALVATGLVFSCTSLSEVFEAEFGDTDNKSGKEVKDKTPPLLTVLSPTNGTEVGGAYQLTGLADDDGSGVETVYYRIGDGEWSEAGLYGNYWTGLVEIVQYGAHTNYVYATDKSGNKSGIQTVWVERAAVPSVVIESPAYGTFTNQGTITVSGTASVDEPYSITKVEVKLNEGNWLEADGTTLWSINLNLTDGNNIIKARAIADNDKISVVFEIIINYREGGVLFVSIEGDDNNPGTRTEPLKSIQAAIGKAPKNSYIYVAEGVYTPGSGLNTDNADYRYSGVFINVSRLTILGGWNSDFTARNGKSELDGNSELKHILWIDEIVNITINGFVIRGGLADGSAPHNAGGGIYINEGSVHTIQNTVISNNTASSAGGGVYVTGGSSHTISGTITGNTANNGGGVHLEDGTNHTISGIITGNTASSAGGGVFTEDGTSHTISGTVTGNTAELGGGVCFHDTSPNATHSFNNAVIHGNSGYGAAIVNRNSNPQGIDTINWGTGNTPINLNWGDYVCVSTMGDDGNNGLNSHPVKSIQKAIQLVESDNLQSIRVAQGIYTPGNGLNNESAGYQYSGVRVNVAGLTILGGWNADFTERNGISELDGNSALKHVVWIDNVANVTIDGFVIRGGNANGDAPHNRGGGIYINQGSGHNIENTVISNNTANNGGGVYVNAGTSHTVSGTITGNTANNGGGVHLEAGTNHTISGIITGNSANNRGGGVFVDRGTSHTISATITGNNAELGGGVCLNDTSLNATHSFNNAVIYGNSEYGIAIANRLSKPQGLDTIDWVTGNTPENKNWDESTFLENIYVSITSGDDSNSGEKESPLKTLQKAVSIALEYATIYVEEGIYTPGTGLNIENLIYNHSGVDISVSGLTILGGWNAGFTERNGISELDGNSALKHVVWINNVSNVTIDGFVIRGGLANGSNPHNRGGGVYINEGSGHSIENTVISNNTARLGGGVYVNLGTSHTISATITGNTASSSGGGVYVLFGTSHTISATITGNTGGGVSVQFGTSHTISGIITGNTGIGVYVYEGTSHTISGTITGNTAYEGGGVYVDGGTSHTISATITGNTASSSGGGVFVYHGTSHTISATISGNTGTEWGGGVYVDGGTSHTISATITGNSANNNGGGVYFQDNSANDTHTFVAPVAISNNSEYGVARFDDKSNPQGLDTINWGSGNTPENMNW